MEKLKKEEEKRLARISPIEETTIWDKPDKIDIITYFLILLFFIAVFQNIIFLSSPDPVLQNFALRSLAVATLGAIGLAMKSIFDNAEIEKKGQLTNKYLTATVYTDERDPRTYLEIGIVFGIGFGLNVLFFNVISGVPLSIFSLQTATILLSIIGAISEELFFTLGLQSAMTARLKWVSIPILIAVFTFYHTVVYQVPQYLIFIAVMRTVYAVLYLITRRWSGVALAHLLNNLIASGIV